jgi:hypothetical protein
MEPLSMLEQVLLVHSQPSSEVLQQSEFSVHISPLKLFPSEKHPTIVIADIVGDPVGAVEGGAEDVFVGAVEGVAEGVFVGAAEGAVEGVAEGVFVGAAEGDVEGVFVGAAEGDVEGKLEGSSVAQVGLPASCEQTMLPDKAFKQKQPPEEEFPQQSVLIVQGCPRNLVQGTGVGGAAVGGTGVGGAAVGGTGVATPDFDILGPFNASKPPPDPPFAASKPPPDPLSVAVFDLDLLLLFDEFKSRRPPFTPPLLAKGRNIPHSFSCPCAKSERDKIPTVNRTAT